MLISKSVVSILSNNPLFENVDSNLVNELAKDASFDEAFCNQDLYVDLKKDAGIVIFIKGSIKWSILDVNGNERIIKFFSKGDTVFIDKLTELFNDNQNLSIIQPTEFIYIKKEVLDSFAQKSPMLRMNMLRLLVSKADEFEIRARKLVQDSVKTRFVDNVMELVQRFGLKENKQLRLPITKKDLCQLLSASKSSVNRIIQDLTDEGAILFQRNKLYIKELSKVRSLIDAD